jgi:3-hydroxy-9,10-secoandrosta-1,3,5(10)-triene-9,17-dione monooxygenase reductase component
MNQDLFKKICGSFVTGVTVITSKDKNIDYGFTANSFTSVSIDPFLILFCLNKDAKSNIALNNKSFFVINILSEKQKSICIQFANNKFSPKERFKGIKTRNSNNQTEIVESGDHYIYIGKVFEGDLNKDLVKPLVYQNGVIKRLL